MCHIARLLEADEVVILDLAPLPSRNKDSFVTRNRIADENYLNSPWLTVPVLRKQGLVTRDALVNPTDKRWRNKHIGRISQCYSRHRLVCPFFVDELSSILGSHDGTLLNLNLNIVEYLLAALAGTKTTKKPRLQSSLVTRHTQEHRFEIACKLNATSYVAGIVEWELMNADGQLEMFRKQGISVLRSPKLSNSQLDPRITTTHSSIHAICREGLQSAQSIFSKLLDELGVSG